MEKCLKCVDPESIKTSMRTANFAREAMVKKGKTLDELQDKIKQHMSKKPRNASK